jgi:serine kinase of HPr protein (carbohydrate metabolism regulator)
VADGDSEIRVHGTAITLGDRAVLLRGPSGSGKSDLALRARHLHGGPCGEQSFELVADDQVLITRTGQRLLVSPPARLAGLMEVRGLGIVALPHRACAILVMLADLVTPAEIERLPDPWPFEMILGMRLPVIKLSAFEASAPAKLALALAEEPWKQDPALEP